MKGIRFFIVFVLLVFMLCGCSEKEGKPMNQEQKAENNDLKVSRTIEGNTTEEKVTNLLSHMSLEEKAGQMVQAARDIVTSNDMKNFALGSVLSGGGSFPGNNTIKDWDIMMTSLQDGAMKTENQIPMLYGIDAVHGIGLVNNAVVYPHNIGLGAANDPDLMYQMGAAVAEEMKLIKILWNFAPCVAVSTDPRWGRTYECYSSDTSIVTSLADAFMRGQADHGVIATPKHYVADGAATFGTGEGTNLIDRGDATMTDEELRAIHLAPYKKLVESGAKVIMASFSSMNGTKMHENKYLLTDVLKKEFEFHGFIVTDWEAVRGLSGDSFEVNVALAINAGVDMVMEPLTYTEALSAIIKGVDNGSISNERIDDAVSRILTVKFDMGLFDDPYMEDISREATELGSQEYRELAKQLVQKSLVLLKNDDKNLPLQKGQKIFVTGPALDNMGIQCGGWGLTWQGIMNEGSNEAIEGTTILEGLGEYAQVFDLEIITDKKRAKEADVVLLVVGEIPYAEFEGDTNDLSLLGDKALAGNGKAIEYAASLNKPVITLIVAGRNVLIEEYMDQWDSIVMCYLPGTEADGIASVLVGETLFSGKLPMPYYKKVADIGNDNAELLYDIGYGLSY